MKKVYTKPEIMFEDFTLSVNIAGDCEVKTNTPSQMQCAYKVNDEFLGELNLFVNGVTACLDSNDGEYNGFCYHTPTEAQNLFNS